MTLPSPPVLSPLPSPFRVRLRIRLRVIAWLCLAALAPLSVAPAQAGADVLAECVALSGAQNDVHACLDNYLDVMDERMERITAGVRGTLSGEPLGAFERAQSAFETFRRDNCLWYLAFNSPRGEAEKIAKGCLARLSLQRLVELQELLVVDSGAVFTFDGHYVFDTTHNSFQPCGSERRFWLSGDDAAIASLQQQYLERTDSEGQRLFVRVKGALESATTDRPGHAGRLRLDQIEELRAPLDSDCRLPGGAPLSAAPGEPVTDTVAALTQRLGEAAGALDIGAAQDNPVADPDAATPPRDERLTAYFGAWLAECAAQAGGATCRVAVDFDGGEAGSVSSASLTLVRDAGVEAAARTRITLALPPGSATAAGQVSWRVDDESIGAIDGARLWQGDRGMKLAVLDRRTVDERLLPLLLRGYTLHIGTRGDGEERQATLVGLSRALAFADDFLDAGE